MRKKSCTKINLSYVAIPRVVLAQINGGERRREEFLGAWQAEITAPGAVLARVAEITETENNEKASGEVIFTDVGKSQLSVLLKIINRGKLTTLSQKLEECISWILRSKTGADEEFLEAVQFAHQVQILTLLLGRGFVLLGIEKKRRKKWQRVADQTSADLAELDRAVAELYNLPSLLGGIEIKIIDGMGDEDIESGGGICAKLAKIPAEQGKVLDLCRVGKSLKCCRKPDGVIRFLLNYIFGFPDFRPAQIDGIIRALKGEDTIALLPTGSGKSIIFQMLALIRPGLGIVVAPIISLINDQVDNLERKGIDGVAGITASTRDKQKIIEAVGRGEIFLLYVAPERLQIASFQRELAGYGQNKLFAVMAIDEAHCVSEWGHDFRTSYLNLAKICRRVAPESPLLALTGTASARALAEMCTDLEISADAVQRPPNFDRPEVHFDVVLAKTEEKPEALRQILTVLLPRKFGMKASEFFKLNREKTMSGIIFCPHVSGDFGVEQVKKLVQMLGLAATEYYGNQGGGQRRGGGKWALEKQKNAQRFKDNLVPLLVATKSFGMGVDKPNVRYTIHYCPPASIEAYYQEAGRGGRDGETTWSFIIVSNDFEKRNRKLLDGSLGYAELKQKLTGETGAAATMLKKIGQKAREKIGEALQLEEATDIKDDVDRLFFFHFQGFPGAEAELAVAKMLFAQIKEKATEEQKWQGDFGQIRRVNIKPELGQESGFEKSLYLLERAEAIEEYTVNFATGEYEVILAKNNEGVEVEQRLATEVEKIYTEIEPGRRQAIGKIMGIMVKAGEISEETERDDYLRKEILAYLTDDR